MWAVQDVIKSKRQRLQQYSSSIGICGILYCCVCMLFFKGLSVYLMYSCLQCDRASVRRLSYPSVCFEPSPIGGES